MAVDAWWCMSPSPSTWRQPSLIDRYSAVLLQVICCIPVPTYGCRLQNWNGSMMNVDYDFTALLPLTRPQRKLWKLWVSMWRYSLKPVETCVAIATTVIAPTCFYHFKCLASGEIKSKKFFSWISIKAWLSLIFTCNSAKIYLDIREKVDKDCSLLLSLF